MRFVVQSKKATLINVLVILFSLSFYIFIFSLVAYKLEAKLFFPEDILLDIKGNPDEFLEPKPFLTVLEELHINLFLYTTSLLVIFSILYRTVISNRVKITLILIGFISMFVEKLSVFGIVYLSDFFAYVKSLSFLLFILTIIIVNSLNLFSFLTGKIK